MPEFLGLPCVELKNDVVSLLVAETVGPRILSLRIRGGENIFAEVPDFTLDCPGAGKCHLWGGHRLWVAPEDPKLTYFPDDRHISIRSSRNSVEVLQANPESGIEKAIQLVIPRQQPAAGALIVVSHMLTNRRQQPLSCAPWAITQLKPGGIAVLSHGRNAEDSLGLLPDRRFTLWPYTDIRSPDIEWGNDVTLVHARLTAGALKLGFPNGLLAYHRDRTVFMKSTFGSPGLASFSECYCNHRFLELETRSDLASLPPGASVTHKELWSVLDDVDFDPQRNDLSFREVGPIEIPAWH